jgi:osmotically-inducible protein OsmY
MPSNDDDLVQDVKNELESDSKLDAASIAVSARDGRVTLRGTVGSLRGKRKAKIAAERVWGVVYVDSQLEVRPLDAKRRDDAELRADVLQALMLDSQVPESVDVKVTDGLVTLTGTAGWQYQREEAEFVAANTVGALDVVNEIELRNPPAPDPMDVEEAIAQAFRRTAVIDAKKLHVSVSNGTVTIRGTVRSWAECSDALAAVWATAGVVSVRDYMTVSNS